MSECLRLGEKNVGKKDMSEIIINKKYFKQVIFDVSIHLGRKKHYHIDGVQWSMSDRRQYDNGQLLPEVVTTNDVLVE